MNYRWLDGFVVRFVQQTMDFPALMMIPRPPEKCTFSSIVWWRNRNSIMKLRTHIHLMVLVNMDRVSGHGFFVLMMNRRLFAMVDLILWWKFVRFLQEVYTTGTQDVLSLRKDFRGLCKDFSGRIDTRVARFRFELALYLLREIGRSLRIESRDR